MQFSKTFDRTISDLNRTRFDLRPRNVSYMVSVDGSPSLVTNSLSSALDRVYRNLGQPVALWRTYYTPAINGTYYDSRLDGERNVKHGYAQPNRCIYTNRGGH